MKENKSRNILANGGRSVATSMWGVWPTLTEAAASSIGSFEYIESTAEQAPFGMQQAEALKLGCELEGITVNFLQKEIQCAKSYWR